ncbi:MAG: DUF421 domain-containing protein [Clostridia bacterium]|nr:DUF421 domain-containing protein [Clostridia bacterium]
MFTLFIRGAVLYAAMILVMRGLGKRQLGEFQPFELAMTILLADVISAPMESVSVPLLNGLLPVAAMFVVHSAISLLSARFDGVRAVVSGKPTVVIERGVVDRDALDRLCLSLSDLLEGLRNAGYIDPSKVGTAIVEANGTISAFPDAAHRSPSTAELGVATGYEGLPLMLILDGRVQAGNLERSGRDAAWLQALLSDRGLRPEQVYLAALDTAGLLTLQLKRGNVLKIQAMEPGRVGW